MLIIGQPAAMVMQNFQLIKLQATTDSLHNYYNEYDFF